MCGTAIFETGQIAMDASAKIALHHHNRQSPHSDYVTRCYYNVLSRKKSLRGVCIIGTTQPLPSRKCSVVYVIISESPETRLVPISIRMHKVESRETSNQKYLSKTILACRERQAKNTNFLKLFIHLVNIDTKTDTDANADEDANEKVTIMSLLILRIVKLKIFYLLFLNLTVGYVV